MKTKLKKLSKSTIAVILSLALLMSMAVIVGFSATNGYVYAGKVYFVLPSDASNAWTNVSILEQQQNNTHSVASQFTQIQDNLYYYDASTMLSYMRNDNNPGIDYCFIDAAWGTNASENSNAVDRRASAAHYTDMLTYQFSTAATYYLNIPASGANNSAVTQTYYSDKDSLKIAQQAYAYSKTPADASYSNNTTGGTVKVGGYYFDSDTTVASGETTTGDNETYDCAVGTTVTMTAEPATGYDFEGWFTSANGSETATSDDLTFTYTVDSTTGKTYYARFSLVDTLYDVTVSANANGSVKVNGATHTSGTDISVGTIITAAVQAVPEAGYDFSSWTVTGGVTNSGAAITDGATTNPLTAVGATAAGALTASFTEKDKQTINVNVDGYVSVTVRGSSVSGEENKTFTDIGTLQAHVGDEITFSAAGTDSTHTYDTLQYSDGTTTSTNTTFTVGSSDTYTYTITATSKVKSGGYFYVNTAAGVTATVTLATSGTFEIPSGGVDTYTVPASTRQKFVVDDTTRTFTITSAISDSSTYENDVVTLITSAADETGTTISSSDTQTVSAVNGATYFVSASEKAGQTESDFYFYYAAGANQNNLASQGKMNYLNGNSGARYIDITVSQGNTVCSFTQSSTSWISTYNPDEMTDPDELTNNIERNENDQHYYNLISFKNAGKVRFVIDHNGSKWVAYVTEAGSEGSVTTFDTYYLGGRFRIADYDTGSYIYTDVTEGSWKTYSIRMPFTLTETANVYKLETNQTIAQLSADLNGRSPYFVIHDKSKIFATTSDAGLDFETKKTSTNALTLGEHSGTLTAANELLFSDKESNSDGIVSIYFDASTKAIWYEVEHETAPVASSVSLTVSNPADASTITAGTTVTLTATATTPHANAGDLLYTFYMCADGENWEVIQAASTSNTCTHKEETVRTNTYKVVVSSASGTDNTTDKPLRPIWDTEDVQFKNNPIYHTNQNLEGNAETLVTAANWDGTAIQDSSIDTETLTLATGATLEFAFATTIPENAVDLLDERIEDFYIDTTITRYCDIKIGSITVEYPSGENTESYVVTTYQITPRDRCSDPTLYVDTHAFRAKDETGETRYYPGKIYAAATYTPDESQTKVSEETVTYYFAEDASAPDTSLSGAGLAIAYWNNSLDNIRHDTWADNIAGLPDTQITQVTTPVEVNSSNLIYVDMTKLYEAKDSSTAKEFKVYSVDLPIWATSFAFMTTDTLDAANVIKTYSWSATIYDYSSILLNPNRIYLLYANDNKDYSKAVVLDKGLWDPSTQNTVGTKTFKTNVINYNSSNLDDFNSWLSQRVYNNYTNNNALYFGLFDYDHDNNISPSLNNFLLVNNLAMRGQTASDYHASVQNLTAEKLDTTNLNSNGFPLLETYADTAKTQKIMMPLFDYDALAEDKQSHENALVDKQYTGVNFPMYESVFNGITTYSFDSSTDPNRSISNGDFVIDTYKIAASDLGYQPFALDSECTADKKYANATEFDVEFFMSNTGALKDSNGTNQDITFNFSGDDDVWVYVDGVLVLDLGGDHMASAGTINFTDMKVYYKTAANDTVTAAAAATGNAAILQPWAHQSAYVKTVDLKHLLAANGVDFNEKDAATKHTFQMFYMERGAVDSNMSISFNLPQASGLNIKNYVYTNYVNEGLADAAQFAADSDYFTYGVSAALNSGALYTNTTAAYPAASKNTAATSAIDNPEELPVYPYNSNTNHKLSVTVNRDKDSETLTHTYPLSRTNSSGEEGETYTETTTFTALSGVTYNLSDTYFDAADEAADHDVSGITETTDETAGTVAGEFHLLNGQAAGFDNKVTPHSFVKVYQKNDLGTVKYTDSNTPIEFKSVSDNGTHNYYLTSYSIYDDQSTTWIKRRTNITPGTSTSIYAADDSTNTNMFYFSDYGKTSNSAAMTVTFYNEVAVGDIEISKEYTGEGDPTFYFDVTFANIFGDTSASTLVEYNSIKYDVYDASGRRIRKDVRYGLTGIAINKGQKAVISGVPVETRYQVTERPRGNSTLTSLVKTIVGPDSSPLSAATPAHGYQESFLTEADLNGSMGTSTNSVTIDGDVYYVNMIPRVTESVISGGAYKTTSKIAFTNKQTQLKVVLKYYDREVSNGGETGLSDEPTSYTYRITEGDIQAHASANWYTYTTEKPGTDDEQTVLSSIDLDQIISFVTHKAQISNVIADYTFWTSNTSARAGIAAATKVNYTNGADADTATYGALYTSENAVKLNYHTGYTGNVVDSTEGKTRADMWVCYKDNTGTVLDFDDPSSPKNYQDIATVEVWGYNYPKKYNITSHNVALDGNSLSEFKAYTTGGDEIVTESSDAPAYIVGTQVSNTLSGYLYNTRVGGSYWAHLPANPTEEQIAAETEKVELLNRPSVYFQNYGLTKGYTGEYPAAEKNFSYEYDKDKTEQYVFAYWASDSAGKNKITTDYQYGYRITKTMDIYPVYQKSGSDPQARSVSITAAEPDMYTSGSKVYRRINNIIGVYNVEPNDAKLTDIAVCYVRLGADSNTSLTALDTNALDLNAIKNNYLAALEEAASWGNTPTTIYINVTASTDSDTRRRATTYRYNVVFETPQQDDPASVQLNNKNRMMMTHAFNNELFAEGKAFYNMLVFAAAKYNDTWMTSDNYILYHGGVVPNA